MSSSISDRFSHRSLVGGRGSFMRKVQNMTIVSQQSIAKNIYELVLSGDLVQAMLQPGQFVNIKINEVAYPLLRRPISICDIDHERNQFTVISLNTYVRIYRMYEIYDFNFHKTRIMFNKVPSTVLN